MPRHEPHGGGKYVRPVVVKLNNEAMAVLDRLRGKTPRSTYLRDLLRAENQRRKVS